MSADLSVRNYSPIAQRAADTLLRSLGGFSVALQIPAVSAGGDAAEIGITTQTYQQLPLSPAIFRKVRIPLSEGVPEKYELMISASAIEAQVGALQLTSADALFAAGRRSLGQRKIVPDRGDRGARGFRSSLFVSPAVT